MNNDLKIFYENSLKNFLRKFFEHRFLIDDVKEKKIPLIIILIGEVSINVEREAKQMNFIGQFCPPIKFFWIFFKMSAEKRLVSLLLLLLPEGKTVVSNSIRFNHR